MPLKNADTLNQLWIEDSELIKVICQIDISSSDVYE